MRRNAVLLFMLKCLTFAASINTLNKVVSSQNIQSPTSEIKLPLSEEVIANFFSDSPEEINSANLKIFGKIPSYLRGVLLRNGPGIFRTKEQTYTHLFDGLAKLTRYEFQPDSQSIKYTSKFIKSQWYDKFLKSQGKIPASITIGPVDPPFKPIDKLKFLFNSESYDNVNVNIAQVGQYGPFLGTTDSPTLLEFDPATLDTIGRRKYDKPLSSSFANKELLSTAHPCFNRNDGYLYNYFLEANALPLPFISKSNYAHVARYNASLVRTVIGTVDLGPGKLPYIHDLSLTEHFAILFVYPLTVTLADMGMHPGGFIGAMKWSPEEPTRIYVFDISKTTGNTPNGHGAAPAYTFEAPAVFAYHHVNAYEEKSDVGQTTLVVDITGYPNSDIVTSPHAFVYLSNFRTAESRAKQVSDGHLYRYNLALNNLSSSSQIGPIKVEPKILRIVDATGAEYTGDMARVNDNLKGKKVQYSYCMTGFAGPKDWSEWAIVKRNHFAAESGATPSAQVWREYGCYPAEPVFVKDPMNSREDGGCLLSEVYDAKIGESCLLVLDATNMEEIARAPLGQVRPFSFHGIYVPDVTKGAV